MTTIKIKGGKTLGGKVAIAPNKNAILPAIAASILTNEIMTYTNMPMSPDVKKMLAALKHMGAEVIADVGNHIVTICCKNLNTCIVPSEHIYEMQAGYLFAGPLLARFGEAVIPKSSGCRLGYRGHEDHAEYFRELGVWFEVTDNQVIFKLNESIKDQRIVEKGRLSPQKREIVYDNPLVTPTENILMLLAGTSAYETEISGIAQEPHVVQLIELLKKMGVKIKGKGSTITVTGGDNLQGVIFTAETDHVDYFGFAIMAAMTESSITAVLPVPLSHGIKRMNHFMKKMGIAFEVLNSKEVLFKGKSSAFNPIGTFPRADTDTFKMNPGPWPMFPVDCLPSFIAFSSMNTSPTTATRSTNWMYTDALKYVPVMKEMGAAVSFSDDQRVMIRGTENGNPYNKKLTVTSPDVIEGARAIISCALSGTGEYTIQNVHYILRRNPDFFDILKKLGADIEIVS